MFELLFEPEIGLQLLDWTRAKTNKIQVLIYTVFQNVLGCRNVIETLSCVWCSGCLGKRVPTVCVGLFTTVGGLGKVSQKTYECDTRG